MPPCGTSSAYAHGCRCAPCRLAVKAYRAELRLRRSGGADVRDSNLRLPVAPLRQLVDALGGVNAASVTLASRTGRTLTAAQRYLHRLFAEQTCSVYAADEVSIAFGHHPFEIYGRAYLADLDQEGATDVA